MSKKVIFAHAGLPFWIDVASHLRDAYGWEICYFIGDEAQKERAQRLFPKAVFHTHAETKNNLAPEGFKAVTAPLDENIIRALSSYESIFLKMMDRFNYDGGLSYRERIATYHKQVMFWKGVLDYFKPDLVVFRMAPHMCHDYVLYALCSVTGVRTLMFERPTIPGLVFPVASFEEESEIIVEKYSAMLADGGAKTATLSPEVSAHLHNLSQPYDQAMPFHEKYKMKRYKGGDLGASLSILWRLLQDTGRGLLIEKWDRSYRQKKLHKRLGQFRRKKLAAHYDQVAQEVDLTVPYVFVALQCEPERQSCPVGGVFTHQYLMIDLLSKTIPAGWKVYVKEHLSQFKKYQTAERSKTKASYDMIAAMPNVHLVPLHTTSFELIDKAQASATVSGTVGWESVVRGKPVLLFGNSWFSRCEGVFVIRTVEACAAALRKIRDGFRVNADHVKCFANVVEQCSYKGYIDKVYAQMGSQSLDENVQNLAKAIYDFY